MFDHSINLSPSTNTQQSLENYVGAGGGGVTFPESTVINNSKALGVTGIATTVRVHQGLSCRIVKNIRLNMIQNPDTQHISVSHRQTTIVI